MAPRRKNNKRISNKSDAGVLTLRVRFGETDPFGIIYFASILKYFKDALDEFIRSKGIDPLFFYRNRNGKYAFPIVSACANYLSPINFDERISIQVKVKDIRRRSIVFSFSANKGNGIIAADGELVLACIDENWKSREIPQFIKDALSKGKGG